MARAFPAPCRMRRLSPLLGCDALTVYGYRAESPDGWRGPFRRSYREARIDARDHNREKVTTNGS